MSRSGIFACAATLGLAGTSWGAIVSLTGQFAQVAAPASLAPGALVAGNHGFAIDEAQNVQFTGPVDVLAPAIGTPYAWTNTSLGGLSGVVSSHIIHVDYIRSDPQFSNIRGAITFDQPIVGLIFLNGTLDFTDSSLGNAITVYPSGQVNRGFAQAQGVGQVDSVRLISPYTISLVGGASMDEIRVLTEGVPTPGSLGVLGLGALMCARQRRRA